ncbi:transglycosylase domain-containing protein [Leptospira terpstrae]|uniref:peptidoglycan glycosyltransferase n=1 Tax=Leptospira terpstrae serovar Hualin str. LT 11-33 = ATCC 700639 TaxID=1257025 RepID=N1VYH8_9LEPT|nr:transglycosylase domain-containing protein [Leptospira terpstrae]EMY62115.1 transglycosylase [Leptospira terpstrae serovar Hualin str. LT 11-33 = ATCC 700639]
MISKKKFILYILLGGSVIFPIAGFLLRPVSFESLRNQTTVRILTKEGTLIGRGKNQNQTRQDWESIHEYPNYVPEILKIAEDKRFDYHHGIDLFAGFNSLYSYLFSKGKRGGASTLTMQLVRIQNPEIRSYPVLLRKVFEISEALRYEVWLTKSEILEAYLNSISIHSNIVGFPSASLTLFGKHIRFLSIEEAVYLTVLIRKNQPGLEELSIRYQNLSERITYKLPRLKDPNELTIDTKFKNKPDFSEHWKGENQHFLIWIRKLISIPSEEFVSSLSSELNSELHAIVNSELDGLERWNVSNASAIVLERVSGKEDELELKGMIGSKNFFEDGNGMVNGSLAYRDAGSTLKPLLYAVAIEKGFYTVNSIFSDEKYSFSLGQGGNYLPRNSDLRYWGDLTLAEALGNSRNIPAVTAINQMGVTTFYRFLQTAGFTHLKESPQFYGPGLALGSGGTSLLQLTRAYGSFPLNGILPKIRLGKIDKNPLYFSFSTRLFSGETAEELKFVLKDPKLRQRAFGRRSYLDFPFPVSIKTGTSKDYRNSWTVAFNDRYVVGAWVGNFSGERTMDVSGSFGAGRIVQNIFRSLMKDKPALDFKSSYTETRNFCRLTGKLASNQCPSIALKVRKKIILNDLCDKHKLESNPSILGVGFVYPSMGQVYLYHPSYEKDTQSIPVRVREYQTLKVPKLVWNGKTEFKPTSNGDLRLPIVRGKHSLVLYDGDIMKASVNFEVK